MKILATGLSLVGVISATAQNPSPFGQFNVRNFDGTEYSGSPQNWDVVQNSHQLLYFANNSGVLEFNGESWYRFEMPNQRNPRSLLRSEDGTVYIAGVGCFGKLEYDKTGKPFCAPIELPDSTIQFEDVWKIHEVGDKIAFISHGYIFLYSARTEKVEVIASPKESEIRESASFKGNLFVRIERGEVSLLSILDKGSLRIISREDASPTKILSLQGRTVIIDDSGVMFNLSEVGGNYKLEQREEKFGPAEGAKINDIAESEEMIAVSVSGHGVYLYDKEFRLIRILQEQDGLSNLEIRKSYFDQYRNLWLCNDNGITYVETSSAITFYDKKSGIPGITEDVFIEEKKINLATHTDLFQLDLASNSKSFTNLGIFEMDVYQVRKFQFPDGTTRTLAILNEGVSEITDDYKASQLVGDIYAWELYQSPTDSQLIYIGLDGDGVGLLRYKDGHFQYGGTLANTAGQVRSMAEVEGQLYYSVSFEGVYRLDTTRKQDQNKIEGLIEVPEKPYGQFDLDVFDGQLFAGTSHGVYFLNGHALTKFEEFGTTLSEDNLGIHRLMSSGDGKLWIVMFREVRSGNSVSEIGYLEMRNGRHEWVYSPFRPLSDDVIYSVTPQSGKYYWFGGGSKVFVYNTNFNSHYDLPCAAIITQIEVEPDSIYMHKPDFAENKTHLFDYAHNSMTFSFSSTAYLGSMQNEYSYFMEGEDTVWSKWTSDNTAVYQRLGSGSYTFRVKARNYYGVESSEATFSFTIHPPWYQTWWAWTGYLVLAILLVYLIIRIAIRRVKRQNEKLEQIVEERTAEIAEQNQQLEHQKTEIEEKNNDILDSIKYAKRIQNTILPDDGKLKQAFDFDHFVLYHPKDIVSGDFYWANRFEDKTIFSAIDCTGHGVPGAFVSIVGNNCLNRAVNEFKLRKPSEILDKLADLVIENFSQTNSQIKDGMDIALCALNNQTLILEYAGANNPLIVVRDGKVIEIKANKQPIGEFATRVPFVNHEFQLMKNDCVYIFSDGYADQFGGEKGKKLKLKNLKTFLEENHQLSMNDQLLELNFRLEHWMTGFEQLDDICIFGVKI